jgi:hypothetical protein
MFGVRRALCLLPIHTHTHTHCRQTEEYIYTVMFGVRRALGVLPIHTYAHTHTHTADRGELLHSYVRRRQGIGRPPHAYHQPRSWVLARASQIFDYRSHPQEHGDHVPPRTHLKKILDFFIFPTANLIIIDVRYQLSTVFSTGLLLENR